MDATASTNTFRISYTGRLMGYFRSPSLQNGAKSEVGCNANIESEGSEEAKQFEKVWTPHRANGEILVGMGDNFAPEIGSRVFSPAPLNQMDENQKITPGGDYQRVGKDLFAWDGQQWVTNEQVKLDKQYKKLDAELASGRGTIPTDNVACFFIQQKYSALVPGKHDFYFGPERLRQLARFLATPEVRGGKVISHGVHMLAANLVIETKWKTDHKPLPDKENPPKFIPRFPRVQELTGPDFDFDMQLNLSDGDTVYPWFQGPSLKISKLEISQEVREIIVKTAAKSARQLRDALGRLLAAQPSSGTKTSSSSSLQKVLAIVKALADSQVFLCREKDKKHRNDSTDPNALDFPAPDSHCKALTFIPSLEDGALQFSLPFTGEEDTSVKTLQPGTNYGIRLFPGTLATDEKSEKKSYGLRFSVYTPFFQFPWTEHGSEECDPSQKGYCDPEPYVLLTKNSEAGLPKEVAIFGVVDTNLGDYVGLLNFAWSNEHFTSKAAAKDPADAITQMQSYFEQKYMKEHGGKAFEGIKVLLAQMSPQKAKILQGRVRGFEVVVSAADPEQAMAEEKLTTLWQQNPLKGSKGSGSEKLFPKALAIPAPYYVAGRGNEYVVDIGSLEITEPAASDTAWTLVSQHFREAMGAPRGDAPKFWEAVGDTLVRNCLPRGTMEMRLAEKTDAEKLEAIQLLSLCAMQKEVRADVALLQKRDLFTTLPRSVKDISGADLSGQQEINLQPLLDRIVWKGDFLSLIYVPGSALMKALDQSKIFDTDDASKLSLSDEKGRGLLYVGVRFDKDLAEYLINEVPLDSKRLYGVATSDYLSAGDTGYPDLASAQVSPSVTPDEFGKHLVTISSVVCRQMSANQARGDCLKPIVSKDYFDEIVASPSDLRPGATDLHNLLAWSIFDQPGPVPGSKLSLRRTPSEVFEEQTERRGLGSFRINPPNKSVFAIQKASFSLSSVNHKFKDSDVNTIFPGSTVPQITAPRSHTVTFDLVPQYAYSWHLFELFQSAEFRYAAKYTGRTSGSRIVSQPDNLLSTDTGFAFHIKDRALPHFEPVFSLHYETLLFNPLPNFIQSLATSSTTPPTGKDLKSRTHFLLPRVGLKWVNRTSWFEAGLEDGKEWNAVRIITTPVPPPGTGTNSTIQRPNIPIAGTFWGWHLKVPFTSTVFWSTDEDGDYFFNKRGVSPSATDTHFRSDLRSSLNFQVWPSLSFAPTYEYFLYQNKLQGNWFWQGQSSIQVNLQLDFWNKRQWTREIKYAPAKSQ